MYLQSESACWFGYKFLTNQEKNLEEDGEVTFEISSFQSGQPYTTWGYLPDKNFTIDLTKAGNKDVLRVLCTTYRAQNWRGIIKFSLTGVEILE